MEIKSEYGTAVGHFVPNTYKPRGEYKHAGLDDARDKADMFLHSIDGNYYPFGLIDL